MKNIYVGVDGGASKCHVRIEDESKNLIGSAIGGPAAFKFSAENAWKTILDTIRESLKQSQIHLGDGQHNFFLGLGLTGCEIPAAKQAFLNIAPPYFKQIRLESDAYTACIGAHDGKDGAIIVVGTGVVSLLIQNNKTMQVCGWGFPHSDEGGGAWLGLEAVRLTFHWLDGRLQQEPSQLLKMIYAKFNNNLADLVTFANTAKSSEFATVAPIVIEQLEKDDHIALSLIKKAASEIELIGEVLEKNSQNGEGLPCALCGGLAPFIMNFLTAKFKQRIVPSKYDAAYGAILMLKK